jgi:hypothetical protein
MEALEIIKDAQSTSHPTQEWRQSSARGEHPPKDHLYICLQIFSIIAKSCY